MPLTNPKFSVLQLSLAANVVLAIAAGIGWWQFAQAKPECVAKQAKGVIAANDKQRDAEGKRDKKLDGITTTSKADTGKALAKAEDKTNARDASIAAVSVSGACRMPDGLPSLDAAVDEANAAAGD